MFGEGTKEQKNLLGGKGANLSEMKKMGVPVPAGYTITTEMCVEYYKNGKKNSAELLADIKEYTAKLEKETGRSHQSLIKWHELYENCKDKEKYIEEIKPKAEAWVKKLLMPKAKNQYAIDNVVHSKKQKLKETGQ